MKEIFLLCVTALIFVYGNRIMENLDVFFNQAQEKPADCLKLETLNIAFMHPEDSFMMKNAADSVLSAQQVKNMNFYYGTSEEIEHAVELGTVDVGVLDPDRAGMHTHNVRSADIRLDRRIESCPGVVLKPLDSGSVERRAVWKGNSSNQSLFRLLDYLKEENSEYNLIPNKK